MAYYAYHHNASDTEGDRERHRQQQEFEATMTEMEQWINVLLLRIQICRRSGPSKDILKGIEVGDASLWGLGAGLPVPPDSDLPYPNTFLMPLFGHSAADYEAFMA